MKKHVSVLAAACAILLSGCAQNNIALYSSDTSLESSSVDITSGAADTPVTSSTTLDAPTSAESTAAIPPSSTAEHIANTDAPTGSVGDYCVPVEIEPPLGVSDSKASVPPSDTTENTAGSTAATESTAPVTTSTKPHEEYAPTYIGGDGGGDKSVFDMDDGTFDRFMADSPSAGAAEIGAMAVPDAMYEECFPCPPYPEPYPEYEPEPPQAGLLTGGEWRDNDHWSDWKAIYSSRDDWNVYKEDWRISFDNRISIKVTSDGKPLEGAKVTCGSASAVTDNKGRAYLFYAAANSPTEPITVDYEEVSEEFDGVIGDAELTCELSGVLPRDSKELDFMIMCDTTGSMSDELSYLQEELKDIITRIQNDNSNIPTRLSVNFYRDEGDEYVVCEYPFTKDIGTAVEELGKQYAAGGGDYPEAVHTALDSAINNHDWQEDSVKLMFLVLDAPPHNDPQIIDSVNSLVAQAAEQGIRIIPIASSGIDKSTEYLLRTMALTTGGTYTFLTNDSGIGGDHIEATVGAYNVERLNDMMVRIVNGYLND